MLSPLEITHEILKELSEEKNFVYAWNSISTVRQAEIIDRIKDIIIEAQKNA